jgi:UDP-N-acetylmuramate--alanine ligase
MHIYFSGIGGSGLAPLALIAHQAGFMVSGSDKQDSGYIQHLQKIGLTSTAIDQSYEHIAQVHAEHPIDWFVYTSALPMEQPDAPELRFCQEQDIHHSKRDDFLNFFLQEKGLEMIAIAGTHGKTTTTAMAVWLCKKLGIPVSYSIPSKISFGEMGFYNPASRYFVYEADEYDRNFLSFEPHLSLITGVDWDHPDIYPTREDYINAFHEFLEQSHHSFVWQSDADYMQLQNFPKVSVLDDNNPDIAHLLTLPGVVNRKDAWLVVQGLRRLINEPIEKLAKYINTFPGVSRRFEQIAPNLYSDYAHTPPKIRGALQLAHEVAGENVVVVYEGLHNTRQHFIKEDLKNIFDDVKQLYIVPSFLAREDPNLHLLTPSDLRQLMSTKTQAHTATAELNDDLQKTIQKHLSEGDLVLCLSAGGGQSLHEWLTQSF